MAVGEDKNKELDLMEQVRNIKCDDKRDFELCKEHALEYIEKKIILWNIY